MLRWMAEFCLGKLRWDEEKLLRADLNSIILAQRGYVDEWDDWTRLIVRANGGEYPDKSDAAPKEKEVISFKEMMRRRKERRATEDD